MQRRQFLLAGVAALAAASAAPGFAQIPPPTLAPTLQVELSVEPADVEMITGEVVFHILFFGRAGVAAPNTPRPVIRATEGDQVSVTVRNNGTQPHAFAIPGVPGSETGPIPPGGAATVTFTAPIGGTYLYLDPLRAPLNRLLGLHGAFVVRPRNGFTPNGSPIPYSPASQTRASQLLFDDLGTPPRFPGNKWDPNDPQRERIWLFTQVDPTLHARAEAGAAINPAGVAATFKPRYFTVNGLSGFDLSHEEPVAAEELHRLYHTVGRIGQPTLVRSLNAGLATHSPHLHGNHPPQLSTIDGAGRVVVRDNIFDVDTWSLPPLHRVDVLIPYRRPPDIPVFPMKQEPFPLRYPMHCHTEMSQTAAGGNYPQGAVLHWEIVGP